VSIEAVGPLRVQPTFDDGHDTGIFSWQYLYELGAHQDERWKGYLDRLAAAGVDRDAPMQTAKAGGSCASH